MPNAMKFFQSKTKPALLLAAVMFPVAVIGQLLPTPPSLPADSISGSVTTVQPTAEVLPLSLDDAIRRGLEHNLQVAVARLNQRGAAGERLQAFGYLLPTVYWQAQRSQLQFNLETEGFSPSVLSSFPPNLIPPSDINNFPLLVTVDKVETQATLRQTLFDLRAIELYRAAKQEIHAVDFSFLSTRGNVIQTVGDSYLLALADEANVANAKSLLATNAEILRQARLEHQAGTIAGLDVLRAQVQYQQQEQAIIAAQDASEKAKVALNREIGLPADQPIQLTDATPYAGLEIMPLAEALRLAYANRQQYLQLQAKLRSAQLQSRAARYERLPTLSFNGNYGLTGTVGGIYHGTFLAQGTLNVPLFKEAQLRGDRDVADAQTANAMSQLASFRTDIEAQIRSDMLDVAATRQLVTVARSNVDLAHATLSDATVRFQNGIDDDLPVVQAQSTLAAAENQLVNSLYQYDVAKLALARSTGVIDQQYRAYLGTTTQATSGNLGHALGAAQVPAEHNQRNGQ